jgi:uncharacterized protein YegP (UPF0339 family)
MRTCVRIEEKSAKEGAKMWKYELFRDDASGDWSWRLRGASGEVVAAAADSFTSRLEARRALVRVRAHAGGSTLPVADGVGDVLGEVLERIAKRDEEEQARRTSIAVLN